MPDILHHISQCRVKFKWILVVSLLTACVDRIKFDVPADDKFLVVEGLITDQPGPYVVKVSSSFNLDRDSYVNRPVFEAKVSLYENDILIEDLVESADGVFSTTNVTGKVGNTYHITIQTNDGKHYMSAPEVLRPVGAVTNVRAEFEQRTIVTANGEVRGDRFNIYVDGDVTGPESYVRWRFAGTYLYKTNPELAWMNVEGVRIAAPHECSGYRGAGTGIVYVRPCTCCTCWVTESDDKWFVASSKDFTDAGYRNVFVGQANVTPVTFTEKYHVQIDQMSLSPVAYEFFRQLAAQADGVESLFQPATGAIKGNISAVGSDELVLGLFYASSIRSGSLDLKRSDVPYKIPAPDTVRIPCTSKAQSSAEKPPYW